MASPYKAGGPIQPHRERAKAAKVEAGRAANAALEPLPEAPPDWLTEPAARNAWRELRPKVFEEVARLADCHFFALICTIFARTLDGDTNAATLNTLAGMMERMGLTPTGRRRLAVMYGIGQGETPKSSARFAYLEENFHPAPLAATPPAEPGEAAPARDNAGRFARFDAPDAGTDAAPAKRTRAKSKAAKE